MQPTPRLSIELRHILIEISEKFPARYNTTYRLYSCHDYLDDTMMADYLFDRLKNLRGLPRNCKAEDGCITPEELKFLKYLESIEPLILSWQN